LKYSIDTSAILDAWRRRYPPDVFPAVWERFDEAIDAGDLGASEEVLLEIEKRDDEVHAWAKARKAKMFVPIDEEQQQRVRSILAKPNDSSIREGTDRRRILSSLRSRWHRGVRW
jgi:hypothetical protein